MKWGHILKNSRLARTVLVGLLLIFLVGGLFVYSKLILQIISDHFLSGTSFLVLVPVIVNTAVLIVGTLIFLAVTKFLIAKHLENRGKKKEIKLILTLYSYVVWGLTIILILSTWFKDIGIFVASLGLIGFGLTFALQKPILNFVGWLTIVVNKPFNIGDRVEVAGNRGDVVAIHTMYTTIQGTRTALTHEKGEKIITFPNEFVLTNAIINYTKRVEVSFEDLTIQITYESNWKKAEKLLYNAADEIVKKFVMVPVQSIKKDPKRFEDVIGLLEAASGKLSRGLLKQTIRENIESMKALEQQSKEEIPEPSTRIMLMDSGIGINVLFPADVRKSTTMKSEISRRFLLDAAKHNDIETAYPHMQVVYDPRRRNAKNNSSLRDLVPSLDDMQAQ